MARRALILVGHGSHLSADSSAPVYDHAARIRASGRFDEVIEAFWKEEPSLRDAIDLVESPLVFVVPLFLAEGYFTRQVVPRELGLEGSITRRGERTILYCRPVGTHPRMASLVVRRTLEMPGLTSELLPETTLLIIGHGTPRSRTSGDTVYRLVEEIREMRSFGAVDCGFLDEDPRIADVLARTRTRRVALVPFFLADGWHTATTIPEELGLEHLAAEVGERQVWYSPPVGTMPEVADIILDLVAAAEAGSGGQGRPERDARGRGEIGPALSEDVSMDSMPPGRDASSAAAPAATIPTLADLPTTSGMGRFPAPEEVRSTTAVALPAVPGRPPIRKTSPAASAQVEAAAPVARARRHFEAWLREKGAAAVVLQVAIERDAHGEYHLQHVADAEDDSPLKPIESLEEFRMLVRFNEAGEYRPLRTRNDLPTGWLLRSPDEHAVWDALAILYPAALLHWFLREAGELEVSSFEQWAGRQTGIYESVRDLSEDALDRTVERCCGSCLRRPLWLEGNRGGSAGRSPLEIPCREPCTLFATVSRASAG